MDATERTEVREMIHDVLSGWQAATVAQNDITNTSLKEIKDHLKELNGKVAKHQQIITENLPHNVSHCTQSENIEALKKAVVAKQAFEEGEESATGKQSIADTLAATNRRDKRFVTFQVIALTLTLAGLVWAIYISRETAKSTKGIEGETRITNDILIPPGKTRGDYYNPFKNDTLNVDN